VSAVRFWSVPAELAIAAAKVPGVVTKWRLRGVDFMPDAVVWRVGSRLVARLDFGEAYGPENQASVILGLDVVMRENGG
jgi:hypothetical protein